MCTNSSALQCFRPTRVVVLLAQPLHNTCSYRRSLTAVCMHGMCYAPVLQLCAGHIRVKNNRNILLKNLLDCAVGTASWFLIG